MKEEGEADRFSIGFRDEDLGEAGMTKQRLPQERLGRDDSVGEPLVFGERLNELEDERHILFGSGADVEHASGVGRPCRRSSEYPKSGLIECPECVSDETRRWNNR